MECWVLLLPSFHYSNIPIYRFEFYFIAVNNVVSVTIFTSISLLFSKSANRCLRFCSAFCLAFNKISLRIALFRRESRQFRLTCLRILILSAFLLNSIISKPFSPNSGINHGFISHERICDEFFDYLILLTIYWLNRGQAQMPLLLIV